MQADRVGFIDYNICSGDSRRKDASVLGREWTGSIGLIGSKKQTFAAVFSRQLSTSSRSWVDRCRLTQSGR